MATSKLDEILAKHPLASAICSKDEPSESANLIAGLFATLFDNSDKIEVINREIITLDIKKDNYLAAIFESIRLVAKSEILSKVDWNALVHELYWNHSELSSKALAESLGLSGNKILEVAGPSFIHVPCVDCDRELELPVKSRQERIDRNKARSQLQRFVCEPCHNQRLVAEKIAGETARKHRAAQLRQMPYLDYLLTPEWKAIRQQMVEAASHRCQVCYKDERLNVHHRTYERRGCEELTDLIVLCESCHAMFHENSKMR